MSSHPLVESLLEIQSRLERVGQLRQQPLIQHIWQLMTDWMETGECDFSADMPDEDSASELDLEASTASIDDMDDVSAPDADDSAPLSMATAKPIVKKVKIAKLKDDTSKKMLNKGVKALENDFVEPQRMALDEVEEKRKTKRNLRFHVAQVEGMVGKRKSKDEKRASSGDTDLPYKQKAMKQQPKDNSKDLARNIVEDNEADDFGSTGHNEDQFDTSAQHLEDADKFYAAIVQQRDQKRLLRKKQAEENLNWSREAYVLEDTLEEGDKRVATRSILKNRGLTPKRKKEQRNPRVKQRKKFERASKKIKSIKRVPIQEKRQYEGETTGIKTRLSRSVRLG